MSQTPTPTKPTPTASVVVPAHDEEAVLARTLAALHRGLPADLVLEVVVVCNGCTDDTAGVARRFAASHPGVRVAEVPEASKAMAVAAGNDLATAFPRLHLDADVEVEGPSVARLLRAVGHGGVHAAGPRRVVERSRSSLVVRCYYDVWERLPQVRDGLFGRGVVALSRTGQERVSALPRVLSDDLAVSEAFAADRARGGRECRGRRARSTRHRDLLRRRVRVVTGNRQADDTGIRGSGAATSLRTLGRLARDEPRLLPRMVVFLGVTLVARRRARAAIAAGDFATWERDESSRAVSATVSRTRASPEVR